MTDSSMKIDHTLLKTKRQQKGWTQQHLSDVSGLSLRTVQRAEAAGLVSHETLQALSATFEVEQSEWFTGVNKNLRLHKGWQIALWAMLVAHIMTILLVWLFVGSVNPLLIKLMVLFWAVVLFVYGVWRFTLKHQKLASTEGLKAAIERMRE